MENLTVFPICYFPPVSWFVLATARDKILIEGKAHYAKQQLTNRMRIKTANGVLPLIIPVNRTGERKPIQDKKISYDTDWQKIHWKSIETAYRSSPYFEFYEHRFAPFYERKYSFLMDYNLHILNVCLEILKSPLAIGCTESYEEETFYTEDYRKGFDPHGKKINDSVVFQPYHQVFGNFVPDLSVFDLICNEGPSSGGFLKEHLKF